MMKTIVAIIYGGTGKEHDVSLMGYPYMESLVLKCGYTPLPVYISRAGDMSTVSNGKTIHLHPAKKQAMPKFRSLINDGENDGADIRFKKKEHPAFENTEEKNVHENRIGLHTEYITEERQCGFISEEGFIHVDASIPLLHGDGGEDGVIQGMLESAGIPYIGADVITSAICLDKHVTKCIAENLGIPTAKWCAFHGYTNTKNALAECEQRIGYPMFIKPRCLGSSVGAYPVYCDRDFERYFPLSSAYSHGKVMVEEMIEEKREIEVAYFSALGKTKISNPAEVLSHGFYSYSDKYGGNTETDTDPNIDDGIKQKIRGYTLKISETVGLKHLGRVDFFLSGDRIIFNEINTFPGFTKESLYPKLIAEMGIDVHDAISMFVRDCINARTV